MTDPASTDASIDHLRRLLTIPRQLMPALLAVYTGDAPTDPAATARLEESALLHQGQLDPLVVTLLGIMTNPALVMTIDVATATARRPATIWATSRRAALGMSHNNAQFEMLQVEPGLLPFHLAQATGLELLPNPPFAGSFSLPAATLQMVEESFGTDPEKAEQQLRRAGVPAMWADRLLIALSHRRALWTVESVWLAKKPRAESSLCALDAGPAGYWRLVAAATGPEVTVAVSSFDDLLRRLAALLPRSIEI